MNSNRPQRLDIGTIYDLLSAELREYLLWSLHEAGRVTADEIAGQIAASADEFVPNGGIDDPRTVTVALVHKHLPRLADHDVVEYTVPTGVITPGPTFADVEPFVASLEIDN